METRQGWLGMGRWPFIQLKIKNYYIMLSDKQKEKLLLIAREAVEGFVRGERKVEFEILDERLLEREGVFVTLKVNGSLRGCIGQIMPSAQPLWQVVQEMAVAAASDDSRFQPVSISELADLEYEISVLSAPTQISDWKTIQLGQDGVIVRSGGRSGVFLPQVADEVDWNLEEFLEHLCADKAGLASDAYKTDPDIEILIFQAEVF